MPRRTFASRTEASAFRALQTYTGTSIWIRRALKENLRKASNRAQRRESRQMRHFSSYYDEYIGDGASYQAPTLV